MFQGLKISFFNIVDKKEVGGVFIIQEIGLRERAAKVCRDGKMFLI